MLGRGGFRVVYEAVEYMPQICYKGVSSLRLEGGGGDDEESFTSKSCNFLALKTRLIHSEPGIVQFVDFVREDVPQLVMEYVPLGNLINQEKTCRISGKEIVALLLQGLEALEYLHSQGVAHRDIKPEYILVSSRWPLSIKLGDLGISSKYDIDRIHRYST